MSKLTELNQFVRHSNDVYCADADMQRQFAYSDGQEVEQRLRWIFSNAKDLSSHSYELKDHISDWPSEYHLSPVRANLLRALDLSSVNTVLELGCGCGSITRYLAEQPQVKLDSVEGSPVRAELAALRCRDLDNVTISTANFNEINFPENEYDLVIFVGVTEYAGRFSDAPTDEQALQDLLALAKRAAKKDGVVLVAIENRTGMKYMMGANEDHYAKPYIGIHDYSEPAGIRTYTKNEWQQQISDAGFAQHEFMYPFPDYKTPMIFLHEDYVSQNPQSYVHLEGNRSRDYVSHTFKDGEREMLFWETAATSGTLGDYANAFTILMGDDAARLAQISPYDFVHLPNFQRKLDYCLHIAKPKQSNHVQRRYISGETPQQQNGLQHHLLDGETFYTGRMLSVEWSRSLISYNDLNLFEQYLKDYFNYLQQSKSLTIDLLPNNLLLLENGDYQAIDEEWQLDTTWQTKLTPEFIFYRAVLFFYCAYPFFVEQQLTKLRQLKTIEDWLHYAFNVIGQSLDAEQLFEYVDNNEAFQKLIAHKHGALDFSKSLKGADNAFYLQWRNQQGVFDQHNQLLSKGIYEDGAQKLVFKLPVSVRQISAIALRPAADFNQELTGFFRLYSIEIKAVSSTEQTVLWHSDDMAQMLQYITLTNIEYADQHHGQGFYITGDNASVQISPQAGMDLALANGFAQHYEITVNASYPRNEQYLSAKERYLNELDTLKAQQYHNQLLLSQADELQAIKQSRSWRVMLRLQKIVQCTRITSVFNGLSFIRHQGPISYVRYLFRRFFATGRYYATRVAGKLGWVERPKVISEYQRWLVNRVDWYWQTSLTLKQSLAVSLIVVQDSSNKADWQRLLKSIVEQTLVKDQLLSVQLFLLAQDDDCLKVAKQVFAEQDNISIDFVLCADILQNNNHAHSIKQLDVRLNGDYVCVLSNKDYLAPQYLAEYCFIAQSKQAQVIYADEVIVNANDTIEKPYFKPAYSPHLLQNMNYIGRNVWLDKALWLQHLPVSQACEQAGQVVHIPKPVLYRADLPWDKLIEQPITPALDNQPLVSVVIPFRDKPQMLEQCLDALLSQTTYKNIEIIGVSNDSVCQQSYQLMQRYAEQDKRIVFHQCNSAFNFSKLVNFGVNKAQGEHIVLMNNDVQIISPDWCEQMLHFSLQENVGVVGAKLLFPDGRVQHAGIALGIGSIAGQINKLSAGDDQGYFKRLVTVNNVMAVTGALLMVKRDLYNSLGGFDQTDFAVAFNDIDFCLKAWQQGYLNVFTPYAQATHYESISRGVEDSINKMQRFDTEKANFSGKYAELINARDVYYNPNLDTQHSNYSWHVTEVTQ